MTQVTGKQKHSESEHQTLKWDFGELYALKIQCSTSQRCVLAWLVYMCRYVCISYVFKQSWDFLKIPPSIRSLHHCQSGWCNQSICTWLMKSHLESYQDTYVDALIALGLTGLLWLWLRKQKKRTWLWKGRWVNVEARYQLMTSCRRLPGFCPSSVGCMQIIVYWLCHATHHHWVLVILANWSLHKHKYTHCICHGSNIAEAMIPSILTLRFKVGWVGLTFEVKPTSKKVFR